MSQPDRPRGAETRLLHGYLDSQRRHVLGILDGLDGEQLRSAPLPSGWTFLAMVRHLTLDIERFWFRAVVAGEPAVIDELAGSADAWEVPPELPAAEVLADYREEIERADEVIAATSPDAAPAWWPEDLFGDWRLADVRAVLLHVISETACHAGHLDAARELVDGRQWLVLDG